MKSSLDTLRRRYYEAKSDLQKVKGTLAFALSLPKFFRDRVTVERAQEEIKRSLESRKERFLELIRTKVYEKTTGPYLRLLKIAGCEFSDLRAAVHRHGLEGTLERLAGEGVYLTSEEFKGKKEVVRGGQSFKVSPMDFERLDSSPGFVAYTSGTMNQPIRSLRSLDWLAVRALAIGVFLVAHDLRSHSHAVYEPILPVATGINNLLYNAKFGIKTDRWFAMKYPSNSWLERKYNYFTTYLVVVTGRFFGHPLPKPEFLDIGDIHRIVRWVEGKRRERKACYLTTVTSSAVRIALAAWEMGVSLEGTKFNVSGEPFTEEKERVIKQVGATATSRYSYGGGVPVGSGCANPVERDEVHVNQYILAVIPHPRPLAGDGAQIHPLLLTTLHSAAPSLLLNVENGDYVTFDRRDCGCALEKAGLTLHLHHIRSYEKFTSEGMNYFYGDLYDLFEKTLPSEFGGGPGDYQLVEEEDSGGQTRLTLLVHPHVGILDEERLLSRLHEGLAQGSRGNRYMTKVWQAVGTLRIRRQAPHASARGKTLPLHISRSSA
jgi:hypothetical protein